MTTTATAAGTTIADFAFRINDAYGDRVAGRYQATPGEWTDLTYSQLAASGIEIGRGLLALGVERGDRIAVLADTRPLWSTAHLGLTATGAVNVSVYPTNSPEECAWVVGNSECRGIVCENAGQVAKITKVRDQLPALEWILVLDGEVDGAISLAELKERAKDVDASALKERAESVTTDDAYMIMYTSGTTGPPKGVVLSHGNYRFIMEAGPQLSGLTSDSVLYLFLPLAHAFALLFHLMVFDVGAKLIYWGGDTAKLVPELAQTQPTHLPAVPRIFEKIYSAVVGSKDKETQAKLIGAGQLGLKVRRLREAGEEVPADLQAQFDAADEAVFSKVRGVFGGNLQRGISGGAPATKEILEFFYGAGIPITEGFGMTETSTAAAMNPVDAIKFGTCGVSLPGQEASIAEDGELLLRGANIFQGYYGMDESKKDVDADGWLHTGDLGHIDEDGYISIVGRKKDIIITAGGKNIAPANFENDLKQCRWISQVVMHGDRRPYPIALVTLDPETVGPWAKEQGIPDDVASLARNEDLRTMIQAEIDQVNEKYARVEQVKKFAILERDLSQESGEVTPTMKIKRKVVDESFADVIKGLYGD
ncbi:AMP-binding protein [Patulibacter sp. NPDC049589]|uniref:AMP-dependent synthetase/ligase n=1 Tax=Patulibacter sp. NPDC049589 TaxID=3154731 RepID=UPI003433E210